jgi:hypothetical protein
MLTCKELRFPTRYTLVGIYILKVTYGCDIKGSSPLKTNTIEDLKRLRETLEFIYYTFVDGFGSELLI